MLKVVLPQASQGKEADACCVGPFMVRVASNVPVDKLSKRTTLFEFFTVDLRVRESVCQGPSKGPSKGPSMGWLCKDRLAIPLMP